jgi:hypothetical protein
MHLPRILNEIVRYPTGINANRCIRYLFSNHSIALSMLYISGIQPGVREDILWGT